MEAQKLGTDKVKEIIGELTPHIVYQDESRRVTLTVSKEGKFGSYSMVHFDKRGIELIPDAHKEILNGGFLGETVRKHNIPFERSEECTFVYKLPKNIQTLFDKSGDSFVKRVSFKVGHIQLPYASIVEIYSPAISFDRLEEQYQGCAQETAREINSHFNAQSYFIKNPSETELKEYLSLAHGFLKKPMHVGIENKEEFVNKTFETGQALLKDLNTLLLVAQKENEFIGYIAANIHPALHVNGLECMLRELYVKEEFRRKGVATSLMKTMERIAYEREAKRTSGATKMSDETHNSFYSSLGYQRRCDFIIKYLGDKNED